MRVADVQVIMMLRLQLERQGKALFPTIANMRGCMD